ncbi:hypothetical protein [Alteromonas sp. CYL-A6]|uniref:hypothetical protein n=1 Tax=Alteromonas nitratireducens TaxID=3390813 RepID=UPI0034B41902
MLRGKLPTLSFVFFTLLLVATGPAVAQNVSEPDSDSNHNVVLLTDRESFVRAIRNNTEPDSIVQAAYQQLFNDIGAPAFELTPGERALQLLDGEAPVCMPFKLKTAAREANYLFSLPTDIYLSLRLYQRESSPPLGAALLTDDGKVRSLTDAIMASGVLILISGHSYGSVLDAAIENIPASRLYYKVGMDPYQAYLQMLARGRGDFALLFPSVAASLSQQTPLREYAISELPTFTTGHLMCNDRPASRAFIDKVNTALQAHYRDGSFEQVHAPYFSDADQGVLHTFIQTLWQRSEH